MESSPRLNCKQIICVGSPSFLPGANLPELVAGWSSALHGLRVGSSGDVCWVWAVIHRPQEAQCEVNREDPPEVMKLFRLGYLAVSLSR